MLSLPSSELSLLVRTDFTDNAAWQRVRSAALAESVDGFSAYVTVIDERAYDGASWEDVRQAAMAGGEHAAVLFIADQSALGEDHPIQAVDLSGASRAPFRCIARELWSVDNNLNLANMDWDEFADNTDADGVFRGFA
ncbi:DUF6924 domain-containing protein [Kribbella flavida]|nr:hypothetical protein [Kribbella flavida]